jgi:putative cell wall-binding protein
MSSPRRRRLSVLPLVVALLAAMLAVGAAPAGAAPTITRIAGVDRYETAAKVSASHFAVSVPVAIIASGEAFPDALAAGPAGAAAGGPVLLTKATSLPSSTAAELTRLKPQKIVVVGGTAAVSDSVFQALDAYTTGATARISGADRFDTAANLADTAFPNGSGVVHIASGRDFPDALAGSAAAGTSTGAMLLVEPNEIPSTTAHELSNLHPTQIIVLGGTSAVSDKVMQDLTAYAPGVQRRFGADRYGTAIAISKTHDPGVARAFLATGDNFPDALAAGPVGGLIGAPVLLVRHDCIPPLVDDELTRLNPTSIVVLGGTGVLSDAVLARTRCAS